MTATLEEFKAAFDVDRLQIARTDHWVWSLRPQQPTLGSGVISLATASQRFSELPEGAGADLQRMIAMVEGTLSRTMRYDKINYLMLMMVDAQVHMHVIPRFGETRSAFGVEWVDGGWPKAPDLAADHAKGKPELLQHLLSALRTGAAQPGERP